VFTLLALACGTAALALGMIAARAGSGAPAARTLPAGGVLAVGIEAVVVHLLSALGALDRAGLLLAHAALGLAAGALLLLRPGLRPTFRGLCGPLLRSRWAAVLVGVVAVPVALSALEYLPNNWDSMTYRMARVARWLQEGSVGFLFTSNPRQNVLTPGAEYVVLVLQGVSGSDALANLPQLAAWVILALSVPALARTLGVPARYAPWAGVFAVAAPMAVLQGSTTQNDLLASLAATGVLAAALPFLHARRRWRAGGLALLLAVVAGAALVKPTAIVTAAPFLAWGAVQSLRTLLRPPGAWRQLVLGATLGLAAAAAELGPFLVVRGEDPRAEATTAPFMYPLGGELADRLRNVGRGLVRHLPVPGAVERLLRGDAAIIGCSGPGLCAGGILRPHEDYAGNPGQAVVLLAAGVWAIANRSRLPRRSGIAMLCWLASWAGFHLVFRDNVWISRLQLPLFTLAGACGLGAPRCGRSGRALAAAGVLLAGHGAVVAVRNRARPPVLAPDAIAAARSPAAYYASGPGGLAQVHGAVLGRLAATGCSRLGLIIGPDSYEYPLAWEGRRAGIQVRHVPPADPWPCAVFTDLPMAPWPGWRQDAAPGLFAPLRHPLRTGEP